MFWIETSYVEKRTSSQNNVINLEQFCIRINILWGRKKKKSAYLFLHVFLNAFRKQKHRYNLVLWAGNEPSLFQHECIEILSIADVSALFSEHLLSGKVKTFKKPNKNQQKKSSHTQPSPVYISKWSSNTRPIFSHASSSSGLKQKCRDTTKRKVKSNCCEFNLLMFIFFRELKV